MITQPPQHIKFVSCGDEAKLIQKPNSLKLKSDSDIYYYVYTKSEMKLGMEVPVTLKQLNSLLSVNLLKILK